MTATQLTEKANAIAKKYEEASIKFYVKDIYGFYQKIYWLCQHQAPLINTSKQVEGQDEGTEIQKYCSNVPAIKRQAIEIHRNGEFPEEVEDFVRKNWIPKKYLEVISHTENEKTSQGQPLGTQGSETKVSKLEAKLVTQWLNQQCKEYSHSVLNKAKKVVDDLVRKINLSKTTIDYLIESTYSEDEKKFLNSLVDTAKSDIQDLVGGFVQNQAKASHIIADLNSLKLHFLEKPTDYVKEKNGTLLLNANPNPRRSPEENITIGYFADPSLSFFTVANASYSSELKKGNKVMTPEAITIMPMLLRDNSYSILYAVAHEIGHKIDHLNSENLEKEYDDLLTCYKDKNSINLKDHQKGEAIADYLGSEVLARQISKLPEEKRKQAVMSAITFSCRADSTEILIKEDPHSLSLLRINGIFAANPSIRKVMGCQGDSPHYKTCGLKTSILDLPELGHSKSTHSKKEGVQ